MGRPWKATPEDEERHGPWGDYTAFVRWWSETIEDDMPDDEDAIWDNLSQVQKASIYAALATAFDATGEVRDGNPVS